MLDDTVSKDSSVMPPDTKQAIAMLNAFASVGANTFNVTLFAIDEKEQGYQVCTGDELKRNLSARLEAASRLQNNLVIRPRSTTALLIQLDDFDDARAGA